MTQSLPNPKDTREALVKMLPSYFDNPDELKDMIECAQLPTPLVRHIFSELHLRGIEILPKHEATVHDCFYLWG